MANLALITVLAAFGGGIVGSLMRPLCEAIPLRLMRDAVAEARSLLGAGDLSPGTEPLLDVAPPHPWEGVAIMVMSAAIWALAVLFADTSAEAAACAGVGSVLLLLAGIDIRTRLLPDIIVLPLMWAGLLFNALGGPIAPADAILGAVTGYGGLSLLAFGYGALRRREVLGAGDAKLLAALGAWLGWEALPVILAGTVAIGLLCAAITLAARRMAFDSRMPMGPSLGLAGWVVMLVGASSSLRLPGF